MCALSLVLNPSHRRVIRPRLGLFAQGIHEDGSSGWSTQLLDGVWQEPIGGNLMLRPKCLDDDAWSTTFTGDHARLGFADFGLAEGTGGWRTGGLNQARMANDGGMTAAAISGATFGGDRGFYLSFYGFDPGTGQGVDIEFGIGASGSANDPACKCALQFMSGGSVYVKRSGVTVGQGDVGGRLRGFNEVLVLPMNVRELLVLSLTTGRGFIQTFDDVEESDPWPRVTPDQPVWFYRPEGAVDVEVAPLRFGTAGSAHSTRQAFAEPPNEGATAFPGATVTGGEAEATEGFARAEGGGTATFTVTKLDGTAHDPASTDLGARIKVAIAGPGTHTPFVHAAVAGYLPLAAKTDGSSPVEIRDRAMRVTLEVPESAADVRLGFSILGRELGVDDALWDLQRLTNVPLDAGFDGLSHPFLRAQSDPSSARGAAFAKAHGLDAGFRDEWALSEKPRHRDPYPYDDLLLHVAGARCLKHGGTKGEEIEIEESAFRLPLADSPARGDWSEIARGGDVPAELFARWMETYAATWIYGWFPTEDGRRFRAGSPDGHFGTAPLLRLYGSYAAAVADGVDPAEAPYRLYREFDESNLQIEANDVRVSGWDPKLRRHIQSRYFDRDSANPSLPWDERPDNWEGLWLPYSMFDRRINSQAVADRSCGIIASRLVNRRTVCTFSTEFMRRRLEGGALGQPLWRGDVVELVGKGVYRLNTLMAEWLVSEPDVVAWGNPRRRCRTIYTAVKGAGACLGANSLYGSLGAIQAAHEEWGAGSRTQVRPRSEFLRDIPVAVQSSATLITA